MNENNLVRLMNGDYAERKEIVAKCNLPRHIGYLTKELMESRNCVWRDCYSFEDISSIENYWENNGKPSPKDNRIKKKNAQKAKNERDIFIRETLGACKQIYVTAIREEKPGLIEIFFLCDKRINLESEARILREKLDKRIKFQAVKASEKNIDLLIRQSRCENDT